MTVVRFQIVFNCLEDYHEKIFEVLKEVYSENYDEFEELSILQQISFQYTIKIEQDKVLIGLEIDFEEIGTEIENVINDFSSSLTDLECVDVVFRFKDENLLAFIVQLHKELFSLEMRLREAITLIFVDTYKEEYYNFLKDMNLSPHFEGNKNLQKDKSQREEFLKKRYENEFFHILFDDYIKLNNPKQLKHDDLFLITEISQNFEEFKKNILERGITKVQYKTFIEEIKNIILPISRIRNCIAHNRMLSTEDSENYQTYFEEINKKIDEFLNSIGVTNFCPHCGGKIEDTQRTLYTGHGEDAEPNAVHHRVGCSECEYVIHEETHDI